MYHNRWFQGSRVVFLVVVLLPFVLGDGVLRSAGADNWPSVPPVGPEAVPCVAWGVDPDQWQELEEYWDWLEREVYGPVFGGGWPDAVCEVGIVLTVAPSRSVLVGPDPDPLLPEAGPAVYEVTDQVEIVGHRITGPGRVPAALPVVLEVVHYVPVAVDGVEVPAGWPEGVGLPEVGVVAGVLRSGDGVGQAVGVMGLVVTLHLAEPGPFAEVGCCFSDGACQIMLAGECLGAGGWFTAVPPLGDLDGDGVDDACLYAVQPGGGGLRLTLFSPSLVLTEEALSAFGEYERVLLELAGAPGTPGFELGRGRGGEGVAGGDSGSPDPDAIRRCIERYEECVRQAKERYRRNVDAAGKVLAVCVGGSTVGMVVALVACSALGLAPPAFAACVLRVVAWYHRMFATCVRAFVTAVLGAQALYRWDMEQCRDAAAQAGCLDRIPIPV